MAFSIFRGDKNDSKKNEPGYKDVFKQKEYLKIILANVINRFGDSIDAIALSWLVYELTGSGTWSAALYAVNHIPNILIMPFAGALTENLNKKKVMVVSDIIRGLAVAALAVLYILKLLNPWILVAFTLLVSTVESFRIPAATALIPKLISKELYTYGTSLNSTVSTVVELIGLGAAGFIIGFGGLQTAILIDAVTFAGSALILSFLKVKEDKTQKVKITGKVYFDTLKDGFIYIKNKQVIVNFCILGIVASAIIVPFNALQGPMISEILGQDASFLSIFGLSLVLAQMVASLSFPMIMKKFSARSCVVAGGIMIGIAFLGIASCQYYKAVFSAVLASTIVFSALAGFGSGLFSAVLNVQFMKTVQEEYLARSASIFNAAVSASAPLASLVISGLALVFSTAQIFTISATLCILLFVFIAIKKVQLEEPASTEPDDNDPESQTGCMAAIA